MQTLEGLSKRMPVRVVQKLRKPIPLEVLAEQLHLNGWLDEQLVDSLLGRAKECVINIVSTDYGPEAVISGNLEEPTQKQTIFPGFYAARDSKEVTIPEELKRATMYIGRKYVPLMGPLKRVPTTYYIDRPSVNPQRKEVTVKVVSEKTEFLSEQEYWDSFVTPELSENPDYGRAMHILAEINEHYRKSSQKTCGKDEAWARDMANYSIYSLMEMLKQHGRKKMSIKRYMTDQGAYRMDDLEFRAFYDPKCEEKIFAGEKQVTIPLVFIEKAH